MYKLTCFCFAHTRAFRQHRSPLSWIAYIEPEQEREREIYRSIDIHTLDYEIISKPQHRTHRSGSYTEHPNNRQHSIFYHFNTYTPMRPARAYVHAKLFVSHTISPTPPCHHQPQPQQTRAKSRTCSHLRILFWTVKQIQIEALRRAC